MYPHERSLVKEYAKEPFAIVGVNSVKSPEMLRDVIVEKNLHWPSFFDGGGTSGPIATQWGVRGWPTVFVLDHKGVIRHRGRGGLDAVINRLVDQAKAESAGDG